MRQKIFGFGILVFFILGIVFPSFVWSNGSTISECQVQVEVDSISLYDGTSWSGNILSGASSYITFTTGSSTSIFDYFAQNVQVSAGTYTKIRVVLNPVVKIYFKLAGDGTYYPLDASFNQDTGIDLTGGAHLTTTPDQGWWSMTLHSGYETIEQNLTLTISEGLPSTIRVEIYNNFGLSGDGLDAGHYTTTANPSSTSLIVVE